MQQLLCANKIYKDMCHHIIERPFLDFSLNRKIRIVEVHCTPVSYTHLDVYKRQVLTIDGITENWALGSPKDG